MEAPVPNFSTALVAGKHYSTYFQILITVYIRLESLALMLVPYAHACFCLRASSSCFRRSFSDMSTLW